jgi:hypothetical protein
MRMNRRTLLKSGAVAGGIAAAPVAAGAFIPPALIVFDGRVLSSRAFAHKMGGRRLDIAQEDILFWRNLRATNKGGRIEGLTSWSDWVLVRGLLEEKGLRVKQEAKAGKLFRWTMA